ncbi:MAG: hypothetical protein FJ149_11545 [Euryarchaeota archaeon]|nr:hypothetical protein [Euryarchaeota archaeon]
MPEGVAYECHECGARVKEEDTKCNSCGAVFEGNAEAPKEPVGETTPGEPEKKAEAMEGKEAAGEEDSDVIDAELIKPETEDGKPREAGKEPGMEKGETKKAGDEEEKPPLKGEKKPGPNMAGIVIAVIGALGLVGAVLLDLLLNIIDPAHPADISIGPSQMAGILIAILVLVAGVVVAFAMRKKGK